MIDPPKRTGYRLTYDAECLYNDWQEIGGCTCFISPPCSSCTHEGHPISLEENDEAWELDLIEYTVLGHEFGDVTCVDGKNVASGYCVESCPYFSKLEEIHQGTKVYCKLTEEVEMSRSEITDKSNPPKSEWFGFKYKVDPETSKLLQEAVFKDGGGWWDSNKDVMNFKYDNFWMFVTEKGEISWSTLNTGTLPEKQPPQMSLPQAKKDFVVGKWYKCISSTAGAGGLAAGRYYYTTQVGSRLTVCGDNGVSNLFGLDRFDINSESNFDPTADYSDSYKHTAYVKFKGYSGKYDSKEYCYKIKDEDYKQYCSGCTTCYASVNVSGEIKTVQIQRITKDYVDSKATKCIIGIVEDGGGAETYYDSTGKWVVPKEYAGVDLNKCVLPHAATISSLDKQIKFNQQEEVNMSNVNRVVSVKFFDDDAGLKAENSLVAEYQITTRVSDQMTISKVLLTEDVAGDIAMHNEVRAATVDLHILKQTGNKVMLTPIEFEDLRVEVRQV